MCCVKCRVRSVECKVWSVKSQVRKVEQCSDEMNIVEKKSNGI